ncbi:hypothetical protein NPIL_175991 [Nephila pilipes]|uniref:Uncharacterized protein n=1 Tax=Nephila pilipes TaxID=299642 RepID=A0A8X6UIU4_NEPPI|nr:hypothetical protein NPIL_175991 [Nephila pilipes]
MSDESFKKLLTGAMILPKVEFSEDTRRIVEKDLAESAHPPEDQPAARDLEWSSDSCYPIWTAHTSQEAGSAFASGSNVVKKTCKKLCCVSPRMDVISYDVRATRPNNMDEPLLNDQEIAIDNLPEQPVMVCCRCVQMRTTLAGKIRNSFYWMMFQCCLLSFPVTAVSLGYDIRRQFYFYLPHSVVGADVR